MYRFEKLKVWQDAMGFCKDVYAETSTFPRQEIYGLISQMRRAATSIPLNIAEGSACETEREYLHFLSIAKRSQYEVATILRLARDLEYIGNGRFRKLDEKNSVVGRQLQALINKISKDVASNRQ